MIWVMTICTQAWLACGSVSETVYQTEKQCYTAMEAVYKHQGKEAIKYIVCAPQGESK